MPLHFSLNRIRIGLSMYAAKLLPTMSKPNPENYTHAKMPNAHSEVEVPVIQEDKMYEDTEVKTNMIEGKHCA